MLISHSRTAIRYWWLLALASVALLVAGIMVFVFPAQSYLALSMLFGWLMLLVGIMEVVLAAANHHFITGRGWMIAGGIIEVILGVILILNVALSAATLPIFLGFWLLMRGIGAIGFGGDMHTLGITGAGWTIACGIVLVICALWILFQPLVVGSSAVIIWVGVSLILAAVAAFVFSLQLRNAHHCFVEAQSA